MFANVYKRMCVDDLSWWFKSTSFYRPSNCFQCNNKRIPQLFFRNIDMLNTNCNYNQFLFIILNAFNIFVERDLTIIKYN